VRLRHSWEGDIAGAAVPQRDELAQVGLDPLPAPPRSDKSLLVTTEVRALEKLLPNGLELLDGGVKAQAEVPLKASASSTGTSGRRSSR
jgi:hypothetical protein